MVAKNTWCRRDVIKVGNPNSHIHLHMYEDDGNGGQRETSLLLWRLCNIQWVNVCSCVWVCVCVCVCRWQPFCAWQRKLRRQPKRMLLLIARQIVSECSCFLATPTTAFSYSLQLQLAKWFRPVQFGAECWKFASASERVLRVFLRKLCSCCPHQLSINIYLSISLSHHKRIQVAN